jgi:hypothetical protein
MSAYPSLFYAKELINGKIPNYHGDTYIYTSDANWWDTLTLPQYPQGDNPIVTIRSDATYTSYIKNPHSWLNQTADMIKTGQEYQFQYHKNLAKWEIISAPTVDFSISAFNSSYQLPNPDTTNTKIYANDADIYQDNMTYYLPARSYNKAALTIISTANRPFRIQGNFGSSSYYKITKDEEVQFIWEFDRWTPSKTLRVLLTYQNYVDYEKNRETSIAHLSESLRRTNEALRESGANVRLQPVGFERITTDFIGPWWVYIYNMEDALAALPGNAGVIEGRMKYQAHMVYYLGEMERNSTTYTGNTFVCGISGIPSRYAMGSKRCGTAVMRHEIGHALGLSHLTTNHRFRTIMDKRGGELPYYATALRSERSSRLPLNTGEPYYDELDVINRIATELISSDIFPW